jgi:hypothetical protein
VRFTLEFLVEKLSTRPWPLYKFMDNQYLSTKLRVEFGDLGILAY